MMLRVLGATFLLWLFYPSDSDPIEYKATQYDLLQLQINEIRENNKGMMLPVRRK